MVINTCQMLTSKNFHGPGFREDSSVLHSKASQLCLSSELTRKVLEESGCMFLLVPLWEIPRGWNPRERAVCSMSVCQSSQEICPGFRDKPQLFPESFPWEHRKRRLEKPGFRAQKPGFYSWQVLLFDTSNSVSLSHNPKFLLRNR